MTNEKRVPWNKGIKPNKPSVNSLCLDKDELYDLYVVKGLSTVNIATHFNCTTTTIRNWMKKYDIKRRSVSDAVKLDRSKWTEEKELQRAKAVHLAWASKSKEELDEITRKKKFSKNINSEESIKKANLTRIANGTSKESKSEKEFYHKLQILGIDKNDIIHHYISDEYPFNCDFYIKSKNLYIEYQGHYTHGTEPFNSENKSHLELLENFKACGKDMSTWYRRDVTKLNVAMENKINLLLVYPRHNTYLIKNGQITTIDINDINKI